MKKRGLICLLTLLFVFGAFISVAWAVEYSYLKTSVLTVGQKTALVNDKDITLSAAPYVKAGKTLVPLRFMENALGAQIGWDKVTRTASLKTGTKEVKVTIGNKTASVNGKQVALDVPAEIKSGLTFVPLRFISENLGASVEYDGATKTISITYADKTGWKEYKEPAGLFTLQYPTDWKVLDDKAGLKLETPNGSIIDYKVDTRDLAAVVKEKKDSHSTAGWQIISEEPLDPAAPGDGTALFSAKTNEKEPEKTEIYFTTIFKIGNGVYVLEMSGQGEASAQDILLVGQMLNFE